MTLLNIFKTVRQRIYLYTQEKKERSVYSVFVINYGPPAEKKRKKEEKNNARGIVKFFRWSEVRVGELRAKHVYDARGALLTPQSSRSTRAVNTQSG